MGASMIDVSKLIKDGLLFKPPCFFEHFKGGVYTLTGYAVHTETQEILALYISDDGEGNVQACPYQMFVDMVEHDGKHVQRFRPL
jgi:hypothetical protein